MKKQSKSQVFLQEMYSNTFDIFHHKDAKYTGFPLHHHDFYEIYLFINGHVDYRIETDVYHLKTGDILFLPPGVFHQPLVVPNKAYERIVLWINEKYFSSITNNKYIKNEFAKEKHIISSLDKYETLNYTFNALFRDKKKIDNFSDAYVRNLLSLILIEIVRLNENSNVVNTTEDTNPTVTQILSYINDNFNNDLTLESIAKTFYLNKYYLSHLFSNEMGTSVYKYIIKKRLVYSHELLENGFSPSEACAKSGFKEYTNFLKSYKNEFGVSPKYHYNKNQILY